MLDRNKKRRKKLYYLGVTPTLANKMVDALIDRGDIEDVRNLIKQGIVCCNRRDIEEERRIILTKTNLTNCSMIEENYVVMRGVSIESITLGPKTVDKLVWTAADRGYVHDIYKWSIDLKKLSSQTLNKVIEALIKANDAEKISDLIRNDFEIGPQVLDKVMGVLADASHTVSISTLVRKGAKVGPQVSDKVIGVLVDHWYRRDAISLLERGVEVSLETRDKVIKDLIKSNHVTEIVELLRYGIKISKEPIEYLFVETHIKPEDRCNIMIAILENKSLIGEGSRELKNKLIRRVFSLSNVSKSIEYVKKDDVERLQNFLDNLYKRSLYKDKRERVNAIERASQKVELLRLFNKYKKKEIEKLVNEQLKDKQVDFKNRIDKSIDRKKTILKLLAKSKDYIDSERNKEILEYIIIEKKNIEEKRSKRETVLNEVDMTNKGIKRRKCQKDML